MSTVIVVDLIYNGLGAQDTHPLNLLQIINNNKLSLISLEITKINF
ncbi:hypothetical protein CNEO2_300003 [Clostridium neonatale]|nr:hypothetical protein CNEO2_130003 [Clostridium neonatale]CAI3599343.1 hypothetical protein CNEO4_1470041 [Clostridium neonatale]CAI3608143.1 hypothetical protein CNEO2_1420040 [Clostridium neonatale]CAI3622549.1 hypothetical protein CNEO2_280003 [Clostridium neonatale]CAI3648203.1 hypothetical protein CNEO2_300003 [Clostridium neonatale]